MALKTLTSGNRERQLINLTSTSNKILLGLGNTEPWAIEASPPDVDPLGEQIEIAAYLVATAKAAVVTESNYSGPGAITVKGIRYKSSADPEVIKADKMNLLYVTATLDTSASALRVNSGVGTRVFFPEASYRSIGVYQYCTYAFLPSTVTAAPWLLPGEVQTAELMYLEHFQSVEVIDDLIQEIQILTRL